MYFKHTKNAEFQCKSTLTCLLVWCEGKALGYRSAGHAFTTGHTTHIRCVLLVNQPIELESTFVVVSVYIYVLNKVHNTNIFRWLRLQSHNYVTAILVSKLAKVAKIYVIAIIFNSL